MVLKTKRIKLIFCSLFCFRKIVQDVIDMCEQNLICPHVCATFCLDDVNDAFKYINEGKSTGKVILNITWVYEAPICFFISLVASGVRIRKSRVCAMKCEWKVWFVQCHESRCVKELNTPKKVNVYRVEVQCLTFQRKLVEFVYS